MAATELGSSKYGRESLDCFHTSVMLFIDQSWQISCTARSTKALASCMPSIGPPTPSSSIRRWYRCVSFWRARRVQALGAPETPLTRVTRTVSRGPSRRRLPVPEVVQVRVPAPPQSLTHWPIWQAARASVFPDAPTPRAPRPRMERLPSPCPTLGQGSGPSPGSPRYPVIKGNKGTGEGLQGSGSPLSPVPTPREEQAIPARSCGAQCLEIEVPDVLNSRSRNDDGEVSAED